MTNKRNQKPEVVRHVAYTPGWQVIRVKIGARTIIIHFDPTKAMQIDGIGLGDYHSNMLVDVERDTKPRD